MVLDSSAIVAVFKQEPGYRDLEAKIDQAERVLVGAPTLVETALVLAGQTGRDQRAVIEAYLHRIGAQIIDFSEAHYSLAADAFVRFGRGFHSKANLNYGDCLAYAVASLSGEPLLFVGDDFRQTDVDCA
jgi:ribonuclease VapC